MTKVLLLALSLPLVACVVGDSGSTVPGGGGDDTGSDPGSDPGGGSGLNFSGSITADTTWTGTVNLLGTVTVESGVTLTMAAGTTVNSGTSSDTEITIDGTVLEMGAKGNTVNLNRVAFGFASGGNLTATYAVHTGGGMEVVTGATVNLTDTQLSHAEGDFLTMSGGVVTVDHSQIGVGAPTDTTRGVDTTHCDMHFNQTTDTGTSVTNSNIASSSYGIMLYTSNVTLTGNNWYGNTNDFEPGVTGVSGDVADGSWFQAANGSTTYTPPGVQGVSFANLSATPIATAGIR